MFGHGSTLSHVAPNCPIRISRLLTPRGPASSQPDFTQFIDPKRKWYNNRRLIALNAWIVLLLITSSTCGYDGSMMNGLQSLPQWRSAFGYPTGGRLGLLNAIQNIGALSGFPIAPYLSDGIGRRLTVFAGASIMVIASSLQAVSMSVVVFIGSRFLIGFGLTLAINAAPMLVTEISYPTYRAPLTSCFNSLWYSGAIIAAWTTFGTFKISDTWAWRIPSAVQGIPSIIQMALICFAPESPRWLISKGRDKEAIEILAYYHADGKKDDPLVKYEYEEIRASLDLDHTVENVGWMSLLSTVGNRKRMMVVVGLAFFSQWSGNGLVSYYLNQVFDTIGIKNPTTQLFINGLLQIWNLFWALLAAFFVERLGRRLLFISSALGMLVFLSLQTYFSAQFDLHHTSTAAHAVIAFIFLFYAAYDIAFTPLIVSYTVEILPYPLRARGLTFFNFVVSLALIFNQYVNPIALDKLGWRYYIVYDCWLCFELAFVYFFVIETKGRTLEETAVLFDGEEATKQIAGQAANQAGIYNPDHRDNIRIRTDKYSDNIA